MSRVDDDAGIVMPPPPVAPAAGTSAAADPWGLAGATLDDAVPEVGGEPAVPLAPLAEAEAEHVDEPGGHEPVTLRPVVHAGVVGDAEPGPDAPSTGHGETREYLGGAYAPPPGEAPHAVWDAPPPPPSMRARWVVVGVLALLAASLAVVVSGRTRAGRVLQDSESAGPGAGRGAVPAAAVEPATAPVGPPAPAGWVPADALRGTAPAPAPASADVMPSPPATASDVGVSAPSPAAPRAVSTSVPDASTRETAPVAATPVARAGDAATPSPAAVLPAVTPSPAVSTGSRTVPGLPRQVPSWSPGNGRLVVRSDVPGAVRVDGVDVGSTEGFVPIELPEGTYRVEVVAGGRVHGLDVRVEAGFPNPVAFRIATPTR